MSPYPYVREATKNGESLLSLNCGIGLELDGVTTPNVTAVDIAPQYIERVKERCPQAVTVVSDSLEFLKQQSDKSYDVVTLIDAIEHMDKHTALRALVHAQRVAKKVVLVFTPQGEAKDGFLKNEPHNAWGIEGADEYQLHKSGWKLEDLEKLGFKLIISTNETSQHGEPYTALMMKYDVLDNSSN